MSNSTTEKMKAQFVNNTLTRSLVSTDKDPAFRVAHDNSVNQMVKVRLQLLSFSGKRLTEITGQRHGRVLCTITDSKLTALKSAALN
jgi:hypothetical protein